MPPNQQPNQQPQGSNPYDFILNPSAPPKKGPFNGSKHTKLISVAFIGIILVVVMIGISVITSLGNKNYNSLLELAQRQTEIVRIADLGLANARDPSTVTYVSTLRNVTLSEKTSTLAFLAKKKFKVNDKQLALKKDASIDKDLTSAKQDNNYDAVLLEKLDGLVTSYQKAEKTLGNSESASEKTLVTTLTDNAKVLTAD